MYWNIRVCNKTQFLFFVPFFTKITNLKSSLINIESIERFKVTADITLILIHNNTLQSFVCSSIALNIHVYHFENWLFLFVVFLQKWLKQFNCFRNYGEMKDMPFYKWTVTWNYACTSFKYFKISLFPLTKKVSLKNL